MASRRIAEMLKHPVKHPQYLLIVILVLLAVFTFHLTSITNQFLGQIFDDEQQIRGVLKISLIYERGVSQSLMGMLSGNEGQFVAGRDQIEAAVGYLATREYFSPEDQELMLLNIEETIAELERLNSEKALGRLSAGDLPIGRLNEISSRIYETTGKEDAKFFAKLSENNAMLTARFRQYTRLLGLMHIIIFTLLILLLVATVKGNKAEQALQDAHDGLERRVAERTRELEASLLEKEILAKEVHHRVKNNLHAISGLFDIQKNLLDDNEALNIFMETQNRIFTMALIHEKLYHIENITKVDLEEYTRMLVSHLLHSFGFAPDSVAVQIDIGGVYLNMDTAIPCGLIINELVTNSLKYAFPNDGDNRIQIKVKQMAKGEYEMTISDNGVGLSQQCRPENSKSLGLKLVRSIVDQLDGRIEVEDRGGMTTRITFKEHFECLAGAL